MGKKIELSFDHDVKDEDYIEKLFLMRIEDCGDRFEVDSQIELKEVFKSYLRASSVVDVGFMWKNDQILALLEFLSWAFKVSGVTEYHYKNGDSSVTHK
jgi:hypothetical protein